MGHHGSDEMSPEMQRMIDAKIKAEREDSFKEKLKSFERPTFGATGQYPMGSLDKSDEGEIAFGITSHRGKVIINFGKPVAWLGMDAHQAADLAGALMKHAARCRDLGPEQKTDVTAKEHAG